MKSYNVGDEVIITKDGYAAGHPYKIGEVWTITEINRQGHKDMTLRVTRDGMETLVFPEGSSHGEECRLHSTHGGTCMLSDLNLEKIDEGMNLEPEEDLDDIFGDDDDDDNGDEDRKEEEEDSEPDDDEEEERDYSQYQVGGWVKALSDGGFDNEFIPGNYYKIAGIDGNCIQCIPERGIGSLTMYADDEIEWVGMEDPDSIPQINNSYEI